MWPGLVGHHREVAPERARFARRRLIGAACVAFALVMSASSAWARQPIRMWFWGAPPEYRHALEEALVKPFNASQTQYLLTVDYHIGAGNAARLALLGGAGPDLVFADAPSDVRLLAHAGLLAPLDRYADTMGWRARLQPPLLASCTYRGALYCLPLSQETVGMFYSKPVLREHGWAVPRTQAELESVMRQAQAAGLYASVTGNRHWQPTNENYSSLFLNQYLGPAQMACLVSGKSRWNSPAVRQAISELRRWYRSGYLGNQDYFALDFDSSLELLRQGRSPFFFAPTILFQWTPRYFKGANAGDLGFAPMPRFNADAPYPLFDLGTAFTYSINAHSKVKDGAALVLDMMMSPRFVLEIARMWPGYWAPPLKTFPQAPAADPIERLYFKTMEDISTAVDLGSFGYRTSSFLPAGTKNIFIQDIEAVWLDQESPAQMTDKIQRSFDDEQARGFVQMLPTPSGGCRRDLPAAVGFPDTGSQP